MRIHRLFSSRVLRGYASTYDRGLSPAVVPTRRRAVELGAKTLKRLERDRIGLLLGVGALSGPTSLVLCDRGLVFGRRGRVYSSCGLGRARRGLPGPRRGSRASGEATGDFGGARGCSNRRPRGCEGASTARRASTPAPRLPSASGAQEKLHRSAPQALIRGSVRERSERTLRSQRRTAAVPPSATLPP